MADACSYLCGHCGMCTAAYEYDGSDSDFFEYAAEVARAEAQRIKDEAPEPVSDDEEECPFGYFGS